MSDIFESSKLRLSRAKEHILTFKKRKKAFLNAKEWTDVIEREPGGVNYLHKIKFTKPFPDDFTIIATEAIEHLRAALDQAGYAVAVASGVANPKSAYFPFANDGADLQKVVRGRCKDIPPDIVTLFCAFQPYKGGNDLLWALNRVCVANKHRRLTPIIIVPDIDIKKIFSSNPATVPQLRWDRSKNEIVYFIVPVNPIPLTHYKVDITINIAFDEIIGGNTALTVLNDMASIVERILLATEAEARRIGLIP